MLDSSVTFYGMLRHLKVHLVQHDVLWPDGVGSSVYRIAESEIYDIMFVTPDSW